MLLAYLFAQTDVPEIQVILPTAPAVSNEGGGLPSWSPCRLFLGPGFWPGARWNRLVEAVETRKKRGKTGRKWARYSLRCVKEGRPWFSSSSGSEDESEGERSTNCPNFQQKLKKKWREIFNFRRRSSPPLFDTPEADQTKRSTGSCGQVGRWAGGQVGTCFS